MIERCNEYVNYKIILVEEKRKKFIINNKTQKFVNKVKVDGCYKKDGKKCDYLFEIENLSSVFYVELKGNKLKDAIEQLKETIIFCKDEHKTYKKESFIISSRVPKMGTSIQVLKSKFKKENNSLLEIGTNLYEKVIN